MHPDRPFGGRRRPDPRTIAPTPALPASQGSATAQQHRERRTRSDRRTSTTHRHSDRETPAHDASRASTRPQHPPPGDMPGHVVRHAHSVSARVAPSQAPSVAQAPPARGPCRGARRTRPNAGSFGGTRGSALRSGLAHGGPRPTLPQPQWPPQTEGVARDGECPGQAPGHEGAQGGAVCPPTHALFWSVRHVR